MNLTNLLAKTHKDLNQYTYNAANKDNRFKSWNSVGLFFKQTLDNGESNRPWDPSNDFNKFFLEGYMNIKPEKNQAGGKTLYGYATDKLRKALKKHKGFGVGHITKTAGPICRLEMTCANAPDIADYRERFKTEKDEWVTGRYLLCGVDVTDGKVIMPPELEKRLDVYVKQAKTKCKAALNIRWAVNQIRFKENTIYSIEFEMAPNQRHNHTYAFSMFMPVEERKNEFSNQGNYKAVRDAATYFPDEFYKGLRSDLPAGLDMLFPAAILKGFTELRYLLPVDESPVEPGEQAIEAPQPVAVAEDIDHNI